jgi:predicted Zn finger-like uncharacterized protein
MILTCPSCGTRYQTDRTRIAPPGSNVRCAKCETVWFQAAADAESEFEPETERSLKATAPDIQSSEIQDSRPRRREGGIRWALVFGWLLLFGFLSGFVWTAITYRNEIASVWPQSATLYSVIDMPVNTRGLAFADLSQSKIEEADGQVLQISGRVVNVADRELAVPEIRISLRDVEERELYGWTFNAGANILAPGQSHTFTTRLPNPPGEARRADLTFMENVGR